MIGWVKSLFESKKTKTDRKTRIVLKGEQRHNLVTDYMINRMKVEDIATKYRVSKSTVYKAINAARRVQ